MSGKSNKKTPIVSILTPSFNHEKYVGFFIDSLLAQTNPNWELIIVDDCSSDNNIAEIKKYSDPRIKLVEHKYNKGINAAINTAFENSTGQYLSLCASDDALNKDFISDILDVMSKKSDIGVIYYSLQGIDINNNIIPGKILTSNFDDRYSALRHCFYNGNCFVSPGMTIRRELFKKLVPLNLAISQYQDYKTNVDLCLRSNIYVSNKRLVKYRIPSEESGISYDSPQTMKRLQLEENILMDSFLQINDFVTLRKIFNEDINKYEGLSKDWIPYILGMLAINSPNEYKKLWGYNQICKFLAIQKNYDCVNKLYGFCFKDFLNLSNAFLGSDLSFKFKKKYKKYKKLFKLSFYLNIFLAILILCFVFFMR